MKYAKFLSERAKRRKDEPIIAQSQNIPTSGALVLGEGAPSPNTFPFKGFSVHLKDGSSIEINEEESNDILQYGSCFGYPPLLQQLKHLTNKFQMPPSWKDRDQIVTAGIQDGLNRAFEMLINEGDVILTQEPCYCSILTMLAPYAAKVVGIPCDDEGPIPCQLEEIVQDLIDNKSKTIKCLYVNPNGSNPTGISFKTDRKKKIYEIACKYDFLILEDDPYYFMQFNEDSTETFLNIDTKNIVLRFDSFSKIISAGFRTGYITGPTELIKYIHFHIQASMLSVPYVVQAILEKLLVHWGEEGFASQIKRIKTYYQEKRDFMLSCADKYLNELCEWTVPDGGMFVWIKVPKVKDTADMLLIRGIKKRLFLLPGNIFTTDIDNPNQYIRASYSLASRDVIDKGLNLLGELIKEEIKHQNEKK